MATVDLVGWPVDQPLRVTGAPLALRAPVPTSDRPANPTAMAQPSLVDVRSASGESIAARSIGLARGQMRLRLDPSTPPGRYAGAIAFGDVARPVEIDVVEAIDLAIRPSSLLIDLALGGEQTVHFAVENRGNVALTIDLAGEYPLGEEIPIFPERVEPEQIDGLQQLADLFARTIGARARRAMRDAGRVTLTMPDGAVTLDPGTGGTVTAVVVLPAGLSPVVRYRAFIPVYSADLELVAVTARKPAAPKGRQRTRSQGAST